MNSVFLMSSCWKILDFTVLPNLYKEMASWLVLLDSTKSREVSPEMRDVLRTDNGKSKKYQDDIAVVTSAYHTNQPHYARCEVLTTIALKIRDSKSSDYEDYAVLRCYPMQLSTKLQCITRWKTVFFKYFLTTLPSHPFQVFLSNVITPVSID